LASGNENGPPGNLGGDEALRATDKDEPSNELISVAVQLIGGASMSKSQSPVHAMVLCP
jgi:hypothetical protein